MNKSNMVITLCLFSILTGHLVSAMENQEIKEPGKVSKFLTKCSDTISGISSRVFNAICDDSFPPHRDNMHRLNRAIDELRKKKDYIQLEELLECCKEKNIHVDSTKALEDAYMYLVKEEKDQKEVRIQLAKKVKEAQKEAISNVTQELSKYIVASTEKSITYLNTTKNIVEEKTNTKIKDSETTLNNLNTIITLLQKGQKLTTEVGEFKHTNNHQTHKVIYPNANNTGLTKFLNTLTQMIRITKEYNQQMQSLSNQHILEQEKPVEKKEIKDNK